VYALGGLTPDRVAACLAAGADGVAVLGAVMRAPDPTAAAAALVAAVHAHGPTRTVGSTGSEP
jgi:thiamine monophosphate synthase